MTVNPGQPIPAELVNAHSDAITHNTHGTQTTRYRVADRRVITGSWSVATNDGSAVGSIAEGTSGNTCQIDMDQPPSGAIVTALKVKVRDGGASSLLRFELFASLDNGTASTAIATAISSGTNALEVVTEPCNYTVPAIGITTGNTRLFAILTTTGGGAGARRLYEFAFDWYRP